MLARVFVSIIFQITFENTINVLILNLKPLLWYFRDGFRISGKGVHMYKGMGVRFADFISFF